jgi:hypothetical protein
MFTVGYFYLKESISEINEITTMRDAKSKRSRLEYVGPYVHKYECKHYPLLIWRTLHSFVYISYPAESILLHFPVLIPGLQLDFCFSDVCRTEIN